MRVAPDAAKALWGQPRIDAAVEEVGHGLVEETDTDGGGLLLNRDEILDIQEVVGRRDGEAADLGAAGVAEVLQLQPGQRRERQP